MSQFDPASYRRYVQISDQKHILVEGKDDRKILKRLWHDFAAHTRKSDKIEEIVFDTAEKIKNFPSGTGNNREKVQDICESMSDKTYVKKFVGFIDRELYQFSWEETDILQDHLQCHDIEGRLVRSRGHSIENYLFEFKTFKKPLSLFSTTPYAHQALQQFQHIFDAVLRYACAVSLAAAKLQVIQRINATMEWRFIEISTASVRFRFDRWAKKLVDNRGFSNTQIATLKHYYDAYYRLAEQSTVEIVRWICHGHLGFDFLR